MELSWQAELFKTSILEARAILRETKVSEHYRVGSDDILTIARRLYEDKLARMNV